MLTLRSARLIGIAALTVAASGCAVMDWAFGHPQGKRPAPSPAPGQAAQPNQPAPPAQPAQPGQPQQPQFARTQPGPARIVDPPTDEQIAAILLAANNTDISYAKLAPARAQSQAIKDFAARMLADHTGVNKIVMDLLNTIDLTPEESKTSLDFRDESTVKRDLMREQEGHAFDSTYIANEITYHTNLLNALDRLLLPSARNAQLRATLVAIRPAVAAHLAHAQMVQTAMTAK